LIVLRFLYSTYNRKEGRKIGFYSFPDFFWCVIQINPIIFWEDMRHYSTESVNDVRDVDAYF